MNRRRPRNTTLMCHLLEDRCTPALTGLPWGDPTHLTMSFAPDGTNVAGTSNQLNTKLNSLMPTSVWQGAITDAIESWSTAAGVNVGVINDNGSDFGLPGPTQGVSHFGDIRIAAIPMPLTTYAEATPPDPYLSGTFAGDIVLNADVNFTPTILRAVVLHEMGHALGLGHSADPLSVMHEHLNVTTTLAASDVAGIRALYGVRVADRNEGSNGNATLNNATRLHFEGEYDGQIPSIDWGDITTSSDIDTFRLNFPSQYSGTVSIRLQSSGISLLAPRLSILSDNGNTLQNATGYLANGNTLTLTLPTINPNNDYYIRVEAAPGAANPVGRYGLAVTLDGLVEPLAMTIDQVLRGPYDTVKNHEAADLFLNPNATLFNDDLHSDDTPTGSTIAYSEDGYAANTLYRITGSLKDATDTDYYLVKSPNTAGPWSLSVLLTKFGPNGVTPRVQLLNAAQQPIATTILANSSGRFAVQATGLAPNQDLYLKILPNGTVGNYNLESRFLKNPVTYDPIVSGALKSGVTQRSFTLDVLRPMLLGVTFSALGTSGSLRMTLTNSAGATVMDLTAQANDTVSGLSTMLTPGKYTLRIERLSGSPRSLGYSVKGLSISDPVGPKATDPTLSPTYQIQKTGAEVVQLVRNLLDSFLSLEG